ncbi:hypothetical protein ANANG_G00222130 [Anguilla anguilla]|uniref:Sushi domain-containing protein n=1 Tax=Anguilla anguilla TaxID=7936 RepID=A0A9D3M431_ANGAN|nr:hypothetical protein ANANG_G00222130 [Anguilla anguilla]
MLNFFMRELLLFVVFFIQLSASEDCGAPKDYPNALPRNPNTMSKYGSGGRLYYTCSLGYRRTRGLPFVRCVEGQWTQLNMKCERKPCGSAGEISNGHFDYMGQEALFGDQVVAVCNEGYRLKGNRYRLCQDSGWNGGIPSCEEGAEITCPNPSVAHGVKIKGEASVYNRGNNVTFSCTAGFTLRGSQEITCGPDGQWHPKTPECLSSSVNVDLAKPPTFPSMKPADEDLSPSVNVAKPTASPRVNPTDEDLSPGDALSDGCRAPPSYPTIVLADRYLLQIDFPAGSRVRYTCGPGYTRAKGNILISRCEGKQWTPINLICERKLCGSAGEILNGRYEYSGVSFGDTATAVCRDGFMMIGRNYRQCLDQGWDGRTPVCEAVKCAHPPEVVNAERTGELEGPFVYSTVIRYRCRQGQLIGRSEIHCTQNGTWNAPPPECIDVTCSSPSVKFGRKTSRHLQHYKYGDYVSFQCDEGYRLNGESKVMCGRTGQWTPQLPGCGAVTCPHPNITSAIVRGKVTQFKYGKSMFITCKRGYKVRGQKQITCGPTGQWMPVLPECYRIGSL